MSHETTVVLNGVNREVEFDYEGDQVIVWNFVGENVCGGVGLTQAQQDDVHEQLWAYLVDWWAGLDDYGV